MVPPACSHPTDDTLRLLITTGLGPVTLARLRDHFGGDDAAIVSAGETDLRRVRGVGRRGAAALHRAIADADPQQERRRMHDHDTRVVLAGDDEYPPLLAAIPDPPAGLWIRGRLDAERDEIAVAVVGSRRCTAYGRDQAGRLGSVLAAAGVTIVSGGALGVDAAAHRGAMHGGGRTIAVLGCGLGVTYPPEHVGLFEDVVRSGSAILSEYATLSPPLARHFPRRNRIISGLSLGVVVVEAARRSGALITARLAAEDHGREVMVVPGRADSTTSRGGLEAVRDGWAGLVMSHLDVLHQLQAGGQLVRGALERAGLSSDRASAPLRLSEEQQAIVDAAREIGEPLDMDELAARTGLSFGRLLAEMTRLEILGVKVRA